MYRLICHDVTKSVTGINQMLLQLYVFISLSTATSLQIVITESTSQTSYYFSNELIIEPDRIQKTEQ